jgi:hypothetical protein
MKKLTPIIFLLFMFALTPQANATFFDFEFDPTVTDLFGYMSDTTLRSRLNYSIMQPTTQEGVANAEENQRIQRGA